jgi:hypothetical protein
MELENLEIVRTVRGANIAPSELTEFIAAYRAGLNRRVASPQSLITPPVSADEDAVVSHEGEETDDDGSK